MKRTPIRLTLENRKITVYLPPSYAKGGSYPVVYLQDGAELLRSCMNFIEHRFITGGQQELIFVCIDPVNRKDDYTPWPAKAISEDSPDFGGMGKAYLDFLVERLKPHVDSLYRTRREPEHTGMIGASLGALISLYAAYQYPQVFGRIGSLSASLWYEGMLDYIRQQPLPSITQRLYLYVGGLEGIHKINVQAGMVPNHQQAYEIWLAKGFPAELLHLALDEGGTHDLMFFAKHFPDALHWLFQDTELQGNPGC